MRDTLIRNLKARFQSYDDLMASVDDATLTATLNVPKHKTLVEHLWCVVGARESYASALEAGEWVGFSCSMQSFSKADFSAALAESAQRGALAIDSVGEWTPERDELLAKLSEHEVMHEGQIIRHLYGIGAEIPSTWQWA